MRKQKTMQRTIHPSLFTLAGLIVAMSVCGSVSAASNLAFTYQGRLSTSGDDAGGPHDIEFRLFATETGGTALACQ